MNKKESERIAKKLYSKYNKLDLFWIEIEGYKYAIGFILGFFISKFI